MRRAPTALLLLMAGCASLSAPPLDPTPEHPRVGCIAQSLNQQARVQGRLMPEVVRVIGVTSEADGSRWKVLRYGVYDNAKWEPHAKDEIRFIGCGKEANAFREVMDAGRREP